jgi:phosphoribosylglycinamide formyltransferase-1
MRASFLSEPILPVKGTFDPTGMSRGEPGVPHEFHWREKKFTVAAVLERWKDTGECRNGSGERYIRKHNYRIRTSDGDILQIYFQRSVGRGKMPKMRWWIRGVESASNIIPFPMAESRFA